MLSRTSLKYPTTILYGCDIDTNTHIKGNHQRLFIFSFSELGIYIYVGYRSITVFHATICSNRRKLFVELYLQIFLKVVLKINTKCQQTRIHE